MKKKILITPRSLTKGGDPALNILSEAGYELVFSTPGVQPSEAELTELLSDCVGYLAGVEPVTEKTLTAASQLKAISRNGTGIDNIDLDCANRLNIKVFNAHGANARGVAELTITLLLNGLRHVIFSHNAMQQNLWERKKGSEFENRTLGVIGFGQIGRMVAQMANGLGISVAAYDINISNPSEFSDKLKLMEFEDVLKVSDFLSFHCPPSDHPILNAETIKLVKPGVYLINTARAGLLDEAVVLDSLQQGTIAGLATDVFETEPPQWSPLLAHPAVITTPHIGGFTQESVSKATGLAVKNLLNFFDLEAR